MNSMLVASLRALPRVVRKGRNDLRNSGKTCLSDKSGIVRPALCYVLTKGSEILRRCVSVDACSHRVLHLCCDRLSIVSGGTRMYAYLLAW